MFEYAKPEQKKKSKDMIQKQEKKKTNSLPNTGISDEMKTRFENMSGFSFDDVRVHYNSNKPAQLHALAYTQGNQVYIAPGEEKHLEHELGHVIQQKQLRVKPTMSFGNIYINNDVMLEKEADTMLKSNNTIGTLNTIDNKSDVIQGRWEYTDTLGLLMWESTIENYRWYYNESTEKMYYVNEKTKKKSEEEFYSYWCNCYGSLPNPLKDESNSVKPRRDGTGGRPGRAGLGLELELILSHSISIDLQDLRKKLSLPSGESVSEKYIKANALFMLADGKVKVTYDTRSNYDAESTNEKASIVTELIFDDSKIATTANLRELGKNLVGEIKNIESSKIVGKHSFISEALPAVTVSSTSDLGEYAFTEKTWMGIHITVAVPLEKLWSLVTKSRDENPFLVAIDNTITDNYDDFGEGVKPFLYLIETMFKGSDSDMENPTNDPKKNMKFMNRTSFGKMFTMLTNDNQTKVINKMENLQGDYQKPLVSTKKSPTFSSMIDYFKNLKSSTPANKDFMVNNDPTYILSKKENTAISGLGSTTEMCGGDEAPIFEFRSVTGRTLAELPELLYRIQKELNSL